MNSAVFLSALQQLPIEKKRQIRRLRNQRAQQQSIIGLLLLKSGLQQLGIRRFHLQKIRFEHQKPWLRLASHFSISHSRQCVCCVVSKNKPVAIDVEYIRSLPTNLVQKHQLKNRNTAPITVWTQKEAVLKMTATNKLNELKHIKLDKNKAHFKNQDYYIQSFSLFPQYTMSIASTRPITKPEIKRVYF